MRLTPQEPEIGPEDSFTEANDLFGYADFGTSFFCASNSSGLLAQLASARSAPDNSKALLHIVPSPR